MVSVFAQTGFLLIWFVKVSMPLVDICDSTVDLTVGSVPKLLVDQDPTDPHTRPMVCTKKIRAPTAPISLCFSRFNGSDCHLVSQWGGTHIYLSDPDFHSRLPGVKLCNYATFPAFIFQSNLVVIRTNISSVPYPSTWEMEYQAGTPDWSCWNQWTSGTCSPAGPDGDLVAVSSRERVCLNAPCLGEAVQIRSRTCSARKLASPRRRHGHSVVQSAATYVTLYMILMVPCMLVTFSVMM